MPMWEFGPCGITKAKVPEIVKTKNSKETITVTLLFLPNDFEKRLLYQFQ